MSTRTQQKMELAAGKISERASSEESAIASRQVELLLKTGLVLAGERDLQKVVQAATDAGRELSNAQFGAFFYNIVDGAGESYSLYTLSGVPREVFSRFPMPRNTAVFGPTFRGEGIVRSANITEDPRFGHNAPYFGMPPTHPPVRSYLAIPVLARSGEVLGGLLYGHCEIGIFTPEAEKLISAVAAQAAVAIENSRLLEQLTRQFEQLRQTEERMREEMDRAREVLESTTDSVFLIDRNWTITYLNRNAIAGVAEGRDLVGKNFWECYPETVGSKFEREYRRVMEHREVRQFEEFYPPMGKWFEVHAHPTAQGMSFFFHDVTLSKANQRAIRDNETRLRMALESGKLGTWMWDAKSDNLDLDERGAEIFDWQPHVPITRDEMRERMVLSEDRALTKRAVKSAIAAKRPYMAEYRVTRHDNSIGWVQAVGQPIYDAESPDETIGMIGTVRDITEQKLQEAALRQTEKLAATGRMAATIAHEINNPLEAVTNLIYLARTSRAVPDDVQRHLDLADEELTRVSHIAQQTLGFYRETSKPADIDVNELFEDVLRIFEKKLAYKSLRLHRRWGRDAWVVGLRGELRQAVSNLLVNAIDASSDGGILSVSTRHTTLWAREISAVSICICDDGCGIPEQIRGRLFSPFFTTKQDVGTGLGLWVTKGIVEKHGGVIRFRSRTGRPSGTLFKISIPRNSRSHLEASVQ